MPAPCAEAWSGWCRWERGTIFGQATEGEIVHSEEELEYARQHSQVVWGWVDRPPADNSRTVVLEILSEEWAYDWDPKTHERIGPMLRRKLRVGRLPKRRGRPPGPPMPPEVPRRIVCELRAGRTSEQIAADLNAEGTRAEGRPRWNAVAVREIECEWVRVELQEATRLLEQAWLQWSIERPDGTRWAGGLSMLEEIEEFLAARTGA